MDMRKAGRSMRQQAARYLKLENQKYPSTLAPLPIDQWPDLSGAKCPPKEIWRSKDFLLQVFHQSTIIERLSINRTSISQDGNWNQDISWDDLQALKRQCGRGDLDAIEVYPKDIDMVNVANMRHLWVFLVSHPLQNLDFIWRKK